MSKQEEHIVKLIRLEHKEAGQNFFLLCFSGQSVFGNEHTPLRSDDILVPELVKDIQLLIRNGVVNPGAQKPAKTIKEKNVIRNYISKGNLEKALKLLYNHVEKFHSELVNDVILSSSRYANLKNLHNTGTMNHEFYLQEKNDVTRSVLELIDRLE